MLMRCTGHRNSAVGPRLPRRRDDPSWDYLAGRPGGAARLIVGLQKEGHKAVNFD